MKEYPINLILEQESNMVKPTAVRPKLCPKCGASWEAIEEMLHTPRWEDNFQEAITIIDNCLSCRGEFWKEVGK